MRDVVHERDDARREAARAMADMLLAQRYLETVARERETANTRVREAKHQALP